jgi:hypothetical protein
VFDGCVADEFHFLLDFSVGEGLFDGAGFVEEAEVGEVGQGDDVLQSVGEADVFADLPVDLAVHALGHQTLYGHVLEHVLQGDVERDHVLAVLDQFCLFLEQAGLLHHQFLVETDCFYVLLQDGHQLQVCVRAGLRVLRYYFSTFMRFIAALF